MDLRCSSLGCGERLLRSCGEGLLLRGCLGGGEDLAADRRLGDEFLRGGLSGGGGWRGLWRAGDREDAELEDDAEALLLRAPPRFRAPSPGPFLEGGPPSSELLPDSPSPWVR